MLCFDRFKQNVIALITLLTCTLFTFTTVVGQDINTGLLMDDDYSTPVLPDFSGKKFREITQLKVDLRPNSPMPQDQGELPSCVGWSVGYAALTIMAAQREGWVNQNFVTDQAFSPHFIYNQLVEDKNCMYAGASFPAAFKLLQEQGICKKQLFNVGNEECSVLPDNRLKQQAVDNRIKDYYQLFKKDADEASKIWKIRKSLAEGYPVVVGMFLTPDFRRIRKGDQYWTPQPTPKNQLYPHAMVVVGYNDVKKSFELMNSWGPDWGNGGYIWVKYDDFAKHCVLAYQIQLPDEGEILVKKEPVDPFEPFVQDGSDVKVKAGRKSTGKVELFGDFVFRYPVDFDANSKPIFEEAEVELMGNHYSLLKKDWEIGQLFQLVARNIKKNRYVYVFSIDAANEANLHWPKMRLYANANANANNQKFGYTESPLVPYNAAEIVIPGDETALQKQVSGDDYLFVLYCYDPLPNIENIVDQVRNSSLPMDQRLEEVLGDDLIPFDEVQFSANKISAKANTANGTILGVMIESKGE